MYCTCAPVHLPCCRPPTTPLPPRDRLQCAHLPTCPPAGLLQNLSHGVTNFSVCAAPVLLPASGPQQQPQVVAALAAATAGGSIELVTVQQGALAPLQATVTASIGGRRRSFDSNFSFSSREDSYWRVKVHCEGGIVLFHREQQVRLLGQGAGMRAGSAPATGYTALHSSLRWSLARAYCHAHSNTSCMVLDIDSCCRLPVPTPQLHTRAACPACAGWVAPPASSPSAPRRPTPAATATPCSSQVRPSASVLFLQFKWGAVLLSYHS